MICLMSHNSNYLLQPRSKQIKTKIDNNIGKIEIIILCYIRYYRYVPEKMSKTINISCCVIGGSRVGKTRLIHHLICEPFIDSKITQHHTSYRLELKNIILIFDDTIGIGDCENSFNNSSTSDDLVAQINSKYGNFDRYKERLNHIYEKADVGILMIDLHDTNHNRIETKITKFFTDIMRLINISDKCIVIFNHMDEIKDGIKKKDNEIIKDFMKKCKSFAKEYIRKNLEKSESTGMPKLHKNIYFYDITKKYDDDKEGESDLDIMKKIFEISGNSAYFVNIETEYKDKLKKRYEVEKKREDFFIRHYERDKFNCL